MTPYAPKTVTPFIVCLLVVVGSPLLMTMSTAWITPKTTNFECRTTIRTHSYPRTVPVPATLWLTLLSTAQDNTGSGHQADRTNATTTCTGATTFVPSQMMLHQVSLRYPVTLARRLFSSVPRREFAVHNVSCQIGMGEIVLLQGASSSGKSALMKVMAGHEAPTHGHVEIIATTTPKAKATPIMLVDKPPFDNQRTVHELLQHEANKIIRRSSLSPSLKQDTAIASQTIAAIMEHLTKWLMLDGDATIMSKTPAKCSPSENYRIRLAVACLQSSLPGMTTHCDESNNSNNNNNINHPSHLIVTLPAPILLLDEWMDFETRDSSVKVEQVLLQLVQQTGAIVICATHKPHLWKGLQVSTSIPQATKQSRGTNHNNDAATIINKTIIKSQMTMCGGEILTLKRQEYQQ